MQQELATAEQSGERATIENIDKRIREHKKQSKKVEKALRRARERVMLITVRGAVVHPGLFFCGAMLLASAARFMASRPTIFGYGMSWGPQFIWVLALMALGIGIYRIYQSLMAIQGVALTSEEAQFQKQVAALETALQHHEERKRPVLEFEFLDNQPPFTFKPGIEQEIRYYVHLTQGDVAHNTEVWFYAPQGFDFLGQHTWSQEEDFVPPRALTCKETIGDMLRGPWQRRTLKIKLPAAEGEYRMFYSLLCEGFGKSLVEFKVKVAK